MTNKRINTYYYFIVAIILLVGCYLRVIALQTTVIDKPLRADALEYYLYAYNLYHHGVYSGSLTGLEQSTNGNDLSPGVVRTPGFPLFVALFIKDSTAKGVIEKVLRVQVLLSVLSLLMVFYIGLRYVNKFVAITALFFMAISPHLIISNLYFLSETLALFLLLMFSLFILLGINNENYYIIFVSGCLLGAASLVRPFIQYFPIFVAVYFLIVSRKKWMLKFFLFLIGFYLIVSPWLVFKSVNSTEDVESNLALRTMLHGLYPDFMYENRPETYGFPYRFDPRYSDYVKSSGDAVNALIDSFKEKPVEQSIWFFIKKPIYVWKWGIANGYGDIYTYPPLQSPYENQSLFKYTYTVAKVTHTALLIMGGVCVLCFFRKIFLKSNPLVWSEKAILILVLLCLYTSLLHIAVAPFPRYSIPLRPELYLVSTYMLYVVIEKIKEFYVKRVFCWRRADL